MTTRAIRIHRTGGPEVLTWEEISLGEPGGGEVLVRAMIVRAHHGAGGDARSL